ESLGATYKGQQSGTLGDYGIYSFNGNKIITTSGGGMLVSNNAERIQKVRFWATQSKDPAPYYEHSELGFNYRMSNVLAGIGRGQLHVLQQRIAKKKYIFEYYQKHLSNLPAIELMPINNWNEPNYWLSALKLTGNIDPARLIEALKQHNIESRHIWKPMHLQPFFKQYEYFGTNVAEQLFETGICLPSDTKMTDEDLERVLHVIKKVWR
ncbi:MAG: DegT/DnrJ/EryC1/StrS family aminotransferase, partial [Lysinibacillus sp.]